MSSILWKRLGWGFVFSSWKRRLFSVLFHMFLYLERCLFSKPFNMYSVLWKRLRWFFLFSSWEKRLFSLLFHMFSVIWKVFVFWTFSCVFCTLKKAEMGFCVLFFKLGKAFVFSTFSYVFCNLKGVCFLNLFICILYFEKGWDGVLCFQAGKSGKLNIGITYQGGPASGQALELWWWWWWWWWKNLTFSGNLKNPIVFFKHTFFF